MNICTLAVFIVFWVSVQRHCAPIPRFFGVIIYVAFATAYFLTFILNPGHPDISNSLGKQA